MSSRGMPVTKMMRQERRTRAEARQTEYDKLSLQEKLKRLAPEPAAARQRARLLGLLEKKEQPKQESAITTGELEVVVAETSPKKKPAKKYMRESKQ